MNGAGQHTHVSPQVVEPLSQPQRFTKAVAMMLEVTIGESICVRMDDMIEDTRLNPEQVEDYLRRMRRTAIDLYTCIPDEEVAALADPDQDQA